MFGQAQNCREPRDYSFYRLSIIEEIGINFSRNVFAQLGHLCDVINRLII
jgi:hypothetical protein